MCNIFIQNTFGKGYALTYLWRWIFSSHLCEYPFHFVLLIYTSSITAPINTMYVSPSIRFQFKEDNISIQHLCILSTLCLAHFSDNTYLNDTDNIPKKYYTFDQVLKYNVSITVSKYLVKEKQANTHYAVIPFKKYAVYKITLIYSINLF